MVSGVKSGWDRCHPSRLPPLFAPSGVGNAPIRLRHGLVQILGIDGCPGDIVLDEVQLRPQLFVVRFEACNFLTVRPEQILVGAALQGFGRQGAIVGLALLGGVDLFVQVVSVAGLVAGLNDAGDMADVDRVLVRRMLLRDGQVVHDGIGDALLLAWSPMNYLVRCTTMPDTCWVAF